jgi:molybdenum cofactor cytidylyltransferase
MTLVGIVLGAGASSRLGRSKQTLPLGDTTVLGWTVRNATAATSLDEVVVVLGGAAAEAFLTLPQSRARVVLNDGYAEGCASSLLAGLDAADGADAIMMLLGDTPGVDADTIDDVAASYRADPTWAAVTRYREGPGHPFVFSAAAFDTLRGLHGDKAVWKIVDREPPERVRRIAVDRPLPRDIDTRDDYLAVCGQLGVSSRW